MKARLTFKRAVEFVQTSTQSIRVALGQQFDVNLIELEEATGPLRIATIGDAITDVSEAPNSLSAVVKATAVGAGEIQLQDENRGVVFWLGIEVYNPAEAVSADVRELGDEPRA